MIVAIWPYALDMTDLAQFTCNIDEEKKTKNMNRLATTMNVAYLIPSSAVFDSIAASK
jgi:hypothetical protein